MATSALDGPVRHLYNQAILKLRAERPVSTTDFDCGNYNSGPRKITSVLNHLSSPSSHNLRVQVGLTTSDGTGCVLRVGSGMYQWFPNVRLHDQDTLILDDTISALFVHLNRKWKVRRETAINPVTPHTEDEADIATTVRLGDDRMIVVNDNIMYVCDIVQVVRL